MKKKLIALLCIVSLCVTNIMPAFATENTEVTENALESMSIKKVNPLYADVISEEDLNDVPKDMPGLYTRGIVYEENLEAIGATIRAAMVKRTETFQIYVQTETDISSQEKFEAYVDSLVEAALAETENPNEGDYLRWQYGGYDAGAEYFVNNNTFYLTISMAFTYYTTAAQEATVTAKIQEVLNDNDKLNLDEGDLSAYEKTKAIYDYICENVVYDFDNLEDDSYKLKYTAYAALIGGTSVCQGYAVLFYRMLEEVDIEARVVDGIGNGGAHGWNISELDEKYYYSDATWDAGKEDYDYFLKGSNDFGDHTPDPNSPAYDTSYDISETSYVLDEEPEDKPEDTPGNGTDDGTEDVCINHVSDGICTDWCDATCTGAGYEIYHCEFCGTEMRTELPETGHTWEKEYTIDDEPGCEWYGWKSIHCSNCDETKDSTSIAPLGHNYSDWIVDSVATCVQDGWKHRTCSGCKTREDKQTILLAGGHNFGPYKTIEKATCSTTGIKAHTCSYCNLTEEEMIDFTDHNYKITKTTKATTKKNGKLAKQCKVCKKKVTETLYRAKSISLSKTKFVYNGKTQKPTVVVKDSKGKAISSSNYKVSFSKGCKNAGTYKVTVKFKGQYSGTLTKTFKITKAKPKITASNFTKKVGDKAFSIKAKISPKGGKVTYKTSNKKIATVSSKGKVTIKKAGKVTITITSAASKNCSKVTKKITVNVKKK